MKKALLSLIVMSALVAFGVAQVEAADIAVTATVTASIEIAVSTGTWTLGATLSESGSRTTIDDTNTITVSNNGNASANLTISSGSSTPSGWTLGAAAGDEVYVMEWSLNGGTNWYPVSTTPSLGSLGAHSNTSLDLKLTAPSETDFGGVAQNIPVTVTGS